MVQHIRGHEIDRRQAGQQGPGGPLGVGQAPEGTVEMTDYVLARFTADEEKQLQPELLRAQEACLEWLHSDVETVMQRFN